MNTLKYIIVGVVLYTITACTATHYTVIEKQRIYHSRNRKARCFPRCVSCRNYKYLQNKSRQYHIPCNRTIGNSNGRRTSSELSVEFHFRFVSGNCRKKYRKEIVISES